MAELHVMAEHARRRPIGLTDAQLRAVLEAVWIRMEPDGGLIDTQSGSGWSGTGAAREFASLARAERKLVAELRRRVRSYGLDTALRLRYNTVTGNGSPEPQGRTR